MVQDKKAISLLRDFVKEKLGGDIHKLKTYDFTTLDDDRKYGSTNHTEAPIVKAVMSLAFGDVWPELSLDQIDHGPYKCATIQTYQNLFGINMCDQYFKGMEFFKPLPAQFQRALKVAHMTCSIGNLWVLPGNGTISNRILDNSYRYYMDKFLKNIYAVLTQQKRVDKALQKAIENSPQMKPYYGEEGFKKFISDMMLEDYVDYYGKPMDIFDFVWSSQRGLDREQYFNAVDQYCSFCEKAFVKRAEKMVAKIEQVLNNATEMRTTRANSDTGKLTKYAFEFDVIKQSFQFAMSNDKFGIGILGDKEYFMTLTRKMGLEPDGFTWEEFSIEVERINDRYASIFYTFPKPTKEPEAIYGAFIIDRTAKNIGYYTLERGLTEDKWALGLNNLDERILIGIYRIKPSKLKFYELIFGAAKLFLDGDVNAVLTMPEGYLKLNNMPDDPEGSVSYGMKTSSCGSFIQAFPIGMNRAMDFRNAQPTIDSIHKTLSDTQALIEVKVGITKRDYPYAYSIIKNKKEPSGVNYFMLLQVAYGHAVLNIKAFFDEIGTTGIRDTMIFELAIRQGIVSTTDTKNWWFDPYDKDSQHPYLMNVSEKEEYDEAFPEHPLSQCRKFAKYLIEKL